MKIGNVITLTAVTGMSFGLLSCVRSVDTTHQVSAELLMSKAIPEIASASSIQYLHNHLAIVGDDENKIAVFDTSYTLVDTVAILAIPGRQSKQQKLDFEASAIVARDGKESLYIFGSGSTSVRKRMFEVRRQDEKWGVNEIEGYSLLMDSLSRRLPQLNIEGAACIEDRIIFSNRGNEKDTVNHLISVSLESLLQNRELNFTFKEISIGSTLRKFTGISELSYDPQKDLLFFTLSQESTADAYNDGAIGHSYLAWVSNARKRILSGEELLEDHLIDLSTIHPSLARQKVEGVCVQEINEKQMLLHVVSDNDDGTSKIFKIAIRM